MASVRIASLSAELVEIPLRRPFATAQDRLDRQVSRPVRVRVGLDNGRIYVGETVAVQYVTGETPEATISAIRSAAPALEGAALSTPRLAINAAAAALDGAPAAVAGLEIAVLRAFAGEAGISLLSLFGGARTSIESDLTLSLADDPAEGAREAVRQGYRRLKLKVGSPDPGDDLARLRATASAAPDAILRVDANQAFSDAGEAIRWLRAATTVCPRIELVEQPTPKDDLRALDAVARAFPGLVFADEACRTPALAHAIVTRTQAAGLNLKLMKSGVAGLLESGAVARAAGRRLMVGCMLETALGIGFAAALACGTGWFDFADLDSHLLLDAPGPCPHFTQRGPIIEPSLQPPAPE
ncbi:MAG TPA: enolase C-terminal domain-like protein [Chthonomonadales bacterium]|nr:enolase C-terminal domain-like protein [Chthonomonadales bacterium]